MFAVLFALGAWSDVIDLFGIHVYGAIRWGFVAGSAAMVASAVWPNDGTRFVALGLGCWATIARGITLLVVGQDGIPRKSELIGGSVWMIASYFVLFTWIVTVPILGWRRGD